MCRGAESKTQARVRGQVADAKLPSPREIQGRAKLGSEDQESQTTQEPGVLPDQNRVRTAGWPGSLPPQLGLSG